MASCLLVLATESFDRFIVSPIARGSPLIRLQWSSIRRRLMSFAFPIAFLSGIAWFGFVVIDMSGLPPTEAFQMDVPRVVWNQTHFGTLWKLRLLFWIASASITFPIFPFMRNTIGLIFSSLLVVSLAWAGHGQDGTKLHLLADGLHLLIAGFWPMGLLPFALLLFRLRKFFVAEKWLVLWAITRRFSAMSLICAVSLIFTGLVNTWFLLGPLANLFRTNYGKVLFAKLVIFTAVLILGAINLLCLKPRLVQGDNSETTSRKLQITVALEWILAGVILFLVGILGLLPPAWL